MSTPGKAEYNRQKAPRVGSTVSAKVYNRKKAARSGSDASGAYKRKQQPVDVNKVADNVRKRVTGGGTY